MNQNSCDSLSKRKFQGFDLTEHPFKQMKAVWNCFDDSELETSSLRANVRRGAPPPTQRLSEHPVQTRQSSTSHIHGRSGTSQMQSGADRRNTNRDVTAPQNATTLMHSGIGPHRRNTNRDVTVLQYVTSQMNRSSGTHRRNTNEDASVSQNATSQMHSGGVAHRGNTNRDAKAPQYATSQMQSGGGSHRRNTNRDVTVSQNATSQMHFGGGTRKRNANKDITASQNAGNSMEKKNIRSKELAEGQPSKENNVPRRMTNKFLKELVTKDPNEILLTIINENKGFGIILKEKTIGHDMRAHVFLAVGKAVFSRMKKNVSAMINMVTSSSNFLKNIIPHLSQCQKSIRTNEPFHLDSLVSLSEFLYAFQKSLPSTASDTIIEVLPLLEKTCKVCLSEDRAAAVLEKLKEMEDQNTHFLKEYTPVEVKHASQREKLQCQNPPESYREIPVLPTIEDIQSTSAFLRPNLVKGQYQDTDHYLDVQFRLLREDYVKPLRDGIAEYLILKKLGKASKQCKDVKVYPDVHIVKKDFVNGGLVHIADFNDAKFARIKWDYCKRFLTGSLLCLSSDDFETMFFATVAKRDTKELAKGLLLLRFENFTDEVLNISPLRSFVVVETSAYFEAYRHNLDALLDLDADTLPMQPYIIEVEKNVQMPAYLTQSSTYDMSPLLVPMDKIDSNKDIKGDTVSVYDLPGSFSQRAGHVQILKNDQWPTASELNLDPSQHAAIKAAITKEFTVIQGPPGTGKTYVGLRIAQLLLHNKKAWRGNGDPSPILVVCYTNHALDQFLEGLMMFNKKIVRVGGRSANEVLEQFQLNNLKKVYRQNRDFPQHIFGGVGHKNYLVHKLRDNIASLEKDIEKMLHQVLTETTLQDVMSHDHFVCLKRKYPEDLDDGAIMHDWLNIRARIGDNFVEVQHDEVWDHYAETNYAVKPTDANLNQPQQETAEHDESEEEADIDFIEAQREIDPEEYDDVSFEVPLVNEKGINVVQQVEDGWKVQGGKKAQQRYVKNNLNRSNAMSKAETADVKDVWALPIFDRWRLYKYWLECYLDKWQKLLYEFQLKLKREFDELCEMRIEEDLFVCLLADVVGMTTTGAAKYRSIVQHLNPKIVIVEEAAEILESHIVTSLAPNTQHVILIGDHQQLKPSPAVYDLAVKYDLNVSLFERMVKNGMDCHRLGIQHRMRPEIASLLVPHIYTDLQNHESVTQFEHIKGVNMNVFFLTHDHAESSDSDSKSKANEHEAAFLIKLCRYLLLQGYDPSQITVLTTYTGQLFALKKLVASNSLLKAVRITVVDNYQGEENDIILISFVRSNEDGAIGFLKVSNRVCVALSRARKGLFCIGNFELLVDKSDLWKNIVNTLNRHQSIGPSLQLTCQNHPNVSTVVVSAKDFDSVPEGGCTRDCDYRLPCGHVCPRKCHPYDREHLEIRCLEPCSKTCAAGHKCKKKCSQQCGDCKIPVDKKLESCGHTIKVACHARTEDVPCTERCERILACGHMCANTCGVACAVKCLRRVKIVSPVCGHEVELECCNAQDVDCLMDACKERCQTLLACGHTCKGSCSRCHQGRLHVICNQRCKRILVCGHECTAPCSKSCPPCRKPCENLCVHSKCPKKCGEPCVKCAMDCDWSCPHKKCGQKCGDLCDRGPCDEPCEKLLKCSHQCVGLCGEPCPSECRICDKEKVTEVFLGSEDEEGARFISVEKCRHIFEVGDITRWMNLDVKGEIQMRVCPRCKWVIRKNLRFGNVVKTCLANIEKVKSKTYGDVKKNKAKQSELLAMIELKSVNEKLKNILEPITKTLSASKTRSIQELTVMHNIINIADSLVGAIHFRDNITVSPEFSDIIVQESFRNLESYMIRNKKLVIKFIQDDYLTASEQQLQEVVWEIERMKLMDRLLKFLYERSAFRSNPQFISLTECILEYGPFREEDADRFKTEFQALAGGAIINISDLEKKTILQAMDLARGHWYQCPNGHVYCITECGGAMQVGRCNECGAEIGGRNHALIGSNRVATAMDGSQHPAWSDQMNMDNYRF